MPSASFEVPNVQIPMSQQLQQVMRFLDLFAVPAFLTDPCNRFVRVNQRFARMVGDPIQDCLPAHLRFIPAAMLGPYRDRFPQGKQEIAQCLPSIPREVAAGRLSPGALTLLQHMLTHDDVLRGEVERGTSGWDGTVVVKDVAGKRSIVREQVIPVAAPHGNDSGFHVSLWLPAEKEPPPPFGRLQECRGTAASMLTPRQLELARWYAEGLTSRAVAARAGISLRTARSHLEHIYARLGVSSRAELVLRLVREGLA
jgi:DNA-binding CsgD family transcriptional regulator